MKNFKKIITLVLAAMLAGTSLTLVSCSKNEENDTEAGNESEIIETTESENAETEQKEAPFIKAYALKGPTGMGMAKLMADNDAKESENTYEFTIASSPDEVTAEIIKGNYDIAALPTNLAAVLYNKTEGNIRVAAVNTLGVLYILENGDTIQSLSDLNGKELYATGQASTPEYILNYVLEANNIDCEVTYLAEHAELATQMVSGDVSIGMLPVPNATTVLVQSDARIAIDLTEEWAKAAESRNESGALYQGCIIINPDFIAEYPEAVETFLTEYAESVAYVNENVDEASVIIESYGIIPKAAIAKAAIPDANMVCITGEEMKSGLSGFYDVLFGFNPTSVGGSVPGDDIYYIK